MESINELFTEEELKILNFSDDEIESILDADALSKTADLLPEEPDEMLNRLDKDFPDDMQGVFDKMAEIGKKNPEYIKKLLALNEVVNEVKEVKPETQKVSADEIKNAQMQENIDKIKEILRKNK